MNFKKKGLTISFNTRYILIAVHDDSDKRRNGCRLFIRQRRAAELVIPYVQVYNNIIPKY